MISLPGDVLQLSVTHKPASLLCDPYNNATASPNANADRFGMKTEPECAQCRFPTPGVSPPTSCAAPQIQRGKLHGSIDVGLSVMSVKKRARRIDLDTEEHIYHLKVRAAVSDWTRSRPRHRHTLNP